MAVILERLGNYVYAILKFSNYQRNVLNEKKTFMKCKLVVYDGVINPVNMKEIFCFYMGIKLLTVPIGTCSPTDLHILDVE